MRNKIIGLIGLLLLLAQVALPAGALAAPAVTVSPGSGPRGTAIGVSATGLTSSTDHLVQLVRGVGNVNTERLFEDRTPSDARGELHYRLAVNQEPGAYTVRIVAIGGTVLATAPFTVTPGSGVPTLTVTPDRGPCTTQPVLGGSGFPAGAAIAIYGQRTGPSGGPASPPRLLNTVTAGPNGDLAPFTQPLPDDCDAGRAPAGTQYTFTAVPPGASLDAATEPERRIVFTVTTGGGAADERHFPETGHTVRGRFLAHWWAHGLDLGDQGVSERESLALFGYPISGEFEQRLEDGKTYTVQYFERARFEHHPENQAPHDVLLGQFGRGILAAVAGAPTAPVGPLTERYAVHFPETGHNVAPDFANFWSRSGGLEVSGYPLSEEFEERPEDGQIYTVQYFERARFERHPAHEDLPYNVGLGQFGRLILGPTGGPGVPQ